MHRMHRNHPNHPAVQITVRCTAQTHRDHYVAYVRLYFICTTTTSTTEKCIVAEVNKVLYYTIETGGVENAGSTL